MATVSWHEDAEDFHAEVRRRLDVPCQHCDQLHPINETLTATASGVLVEYWCSGCGERRAAFIPNG